MMVNNIKGVGEKKAEALNKLGIFTCEDLINYFPKTYEDRRYTVSLDQLEIGKPSLTKGKIVQIVKDRYRGRNKQTLRILVRDENSSIEVVFFSAGFLAKSFNVGDEFFFFGTPTLNKGRMQLVHPEFSRDSHSMDRGITPIYKLAKSLSQKEMRKWQKELSSLSENAEEWLPLGLIKKHGICSVRNALENIHFPSDIDSLKEAKKRLIFDELFALQLGILMMKEEGKKGIEFTHKQVEKEYIKTLPYKLTKAQERTADEIIKDMEREINMNRLVQGDVGSGKTVIAEIAMYKAVKNGYQAAFMAPTELLMKQHYEGLLKAFTHFGIKVAYLSGSMKAKEKREALKGLEKGEIDIVVGTHAVIQKNVEFKKLGLVITDEQHRFGVNQRIKLREKGMNPDVLVMTATPIPRTLAVLFYGDMDVSTIDELPPGRQMIRTKAVTEKARHKAYKFLKEEVSKGRQAYVVAPLIEESETLDVKSVESLYEELKEDFKDFEIGLLHGAMKQNEKDEIMSNFYDGHYSILVATVVIEVGIDVPNATVMIIENAERFGLAQLHQLRGRVGRGKEQSYCLLVTKSDGEIALKRSEIISSSTDGFYIAEKDLELRGPGEIFGNRQHGIPDMNIANLDEHMNILNKLRPDAMKIVEENPSLLGEERKLMREKVEKLFGEDMNMDL